MNYIEVFFTVDPCHETNTDILSAMAGEIGFESFIETDNGINAYIPDVLYDAATLQKLIANFPLPDVQIHYTVKKAENKNWNETWEQQTFQPILIEDRCCIHSTYHTNVPHVEYDIVINPQMAFGTGYHETTRSIIVELLNMDLKGKTILDMGCGTSILSILCSMRGASSVTAIDIDDWSVNNSRENIKLNHLTNIRVELGNADLLSEKKPFDIILANINRNILLADMHAYVHCMRTDSILLMSGFYMEDLPLIKEKAEELGLRFECSHEKNNWIVAQFMKP